MDFKKITSKYGFHLLALVLFSIISIAYFKPALDGYILKQADLKHYVESSREAVDYIEKDHEIPLWTESMFSGMPTAQVHPEYPGNWTKRVMNSVHELFNPPIGYLFLYLVGFYIFGLCIGLNKWVNLIGAIAFAFSSYNIVILQAGHVTKAAAIAYSLPVIGAFIMAYRRNWKWGAIIFGIALAMQVTANHLQITYYLLFLFLGLGIYFLMDALKTKTVKSFLKTTIALLGAGILAVLVNIGNIKITQDFSKYTIRGGNDLTMNVDGTPIDKSNEDGLDLSYITNWSYGIGETATLFSPYVKGGASEPVANSPFKEMVENSDISTEAQSFVLNYYSYWGNQPFTSGPVYFGAIVFFLAILSLVFLKSSIKWAYLAVALLTIALSWGSNWMGLTEFFANYVPGYNKFRAVTIILAITSMIFPILAVLILNQFYIERENLKEQKKKFFIVSGSFILFLLVLKFVGLNDNYFSVTDKQQLASVLDKNQQRASVLQQINTMSPEQLAQNGIDKNNPQQIDQIVNAQIEKMSKMYDVNALTTVRQDIYNYSMNRTLLFVLLATGLLSLLFVTKTDFKIVTIGLGVLIAIDLITVDLNYLNNDEDANGNLVYWEDAINKYYPDAATPADLAILDSEIKQKPTLNALMEKAERAGKERAENEGFLSTTEINRVIDYEKFRALNRVTNYRVLDLTTNPFNSNRASYFHKSIGGYFGAKLRNYQNLIEHHLSGSLNFKVLEMLNTKYIIQQNGQMVQNPTSLGNAWLVRTIHTVNTPDEEIRSLGSIYDVKPYSVAQLIVDDEVKTEAKIDGKEKVAVVVQGDTIPVVIPSELQKSLSAGMDNEMEAVLVMDKNKKTDFVPKILLEKDSTQSFLKLMDLKVDYNFEPATDAVMLKSEASKLSGKMYSGLGTVKMTSYNPMELKYNFDSKEKQFVVFSEVYYNDGWNVYVDGEKASIVKVNYLLRGVEVPAGTHKIEMKYEYPFFKTANMLSRTGFILFLVLIGIGVWTDRKKKKKN